MTCEWECYCLASTRSRKGNPLIAYIHFARRLSRLANRLMQSSDSPIMRMAPQIANTFEEPVMIPVLGSTSAKLIWTEAWSLAWMMRLLAELQWKHAKILDEHQCFAEQLLGYVHCNFRSGRFIDILILIWMAFDKTNRNYIQSLETRKSGFQTGGNVVNRLAAQFQRHVGLTIYADSTSQQILRRRFPFCVSC